MVSHSALPHDAQGTFGRSSDSKHLRDKIITQLIDGSTKITKCNRILIEKSTGYVL